MVIRAVERTGDEIHAEDLKPAFESVICGG